MPDKPQPLSSELLYILPNPIYHQIHQLHHCENLVKIKRKYLTLVFIADILLSVPLCVTQLVTKSLRWTGVTYARGT